MPFLPPWFQVVGHACSSAVTLIWLAIPQNTNHCEREWSKLIKWGGLEFCSWAVKPCITEKRLALRLNWLSGPSQSKVLEFKFRTWQRLTAFVPPTSSYSLELEQVLPLWLLCCCSLRVSLSRFIHGDYSKTSRTLWRNGVSSYHADELSQRHLQLHYDSLCPVDGRPDEWIVAVLPQQQVHEALFRLGAVATCWYRCLKIFFFFFTTFTRRQLWGGYIHYQSVCLFFVRLTNEPSSALWKLKVT